MAAKVYIGTAKPTKSKDSYPKLMVYAKGTANEQIWLLCTSKSGVCLSATPTEKLNGTISTQGNFISSQWEDYDLPVTIQNE